MQLHATTLRSDQLFKYFLNLSILKGETLHIKEPKQHMIETLQLLVPYLKADLKGAGVDSKECYFTPKKLPKKYLLDLEGNDALPFLQSLFCAFIFCGHQVSLTCTNTKASSTSYYYLRDVLLPQLYPLLSFRSFHIEPNGDVTLTLKGKYILETAPAFIVVPQPKLIAIRGELELADFSQVTFIELSLKEIGVPLRLHHVSSKQESLIHLNALYGTVEGYDNDTSYIMYADAMGKIDIPSFLSSFKSQLTQPTLSQELIEDLLLLIGLIGGELPATYEETTFLLDDLEKELETKIKIKQGTYHCSKSLSAVDSSNNSS